MDYIANRSLRTYLKHPDPREEQTALLLNPKLGSQKTSRLRRVGRQLSLLRIEKGRSCRGDREIEGLIEVGAARTLALHAACSTRAARSAATAAATTPLSLRLSRSPLLAARHARCTAPAARCSLIAAAASRLTALARHAACKRARNKPSFLAVRKSGV